MTSERIAELEAALDLARRCSTCEGQAHASGIVCICGGSGLRDDEVQNLRTVALDREIARDEAVAQVASWRDWAEDVIDELALLPEWGHTAQLREQGIKLFDNPLPAAAALLRKVEAGLAMAGAVSRWIDGAPTASIVQALSAYETEVGLTEIDRGNYVTLEQLHDAARGKGK